MDPAEHEQLRNAVCLQGVVIGNQKVLLQGVMAGLKDVSERHDQTYQALLAQFQALAASLTPTAPPANPSNMVPEPASAPPAAANPHEPRLPSPERYDGDPETCRSFICQCSLIFQLQPSTFPTERSRVAYLVTLTLGRARAWATAIWELQSSVCFSYEEFTAELRKVFDSPISGREAARKLLRIRQGTGGVSNYAIDFRTLAAESMWNTGSLFGAFLNGLSEEIKDELATRELPATLEALISLAIRMDSRLREREREQKELHGVKHALPFSPPSRQPGRSAEILRERTKAVQPEPMQLGRAKLSLAERQRRIASRSCLYCGELGHFIATCPLKGQARQ
ncbi:hypothetical protein DPEC_G00098370 [Dallia pectoralis]|uniref:Uncharacterized protein n=1 Tax=Dallia pectoralis TaxID=75939 RepID=A0ACC2GWQ2_DALPE|nr:hypothetical protein DPEC_G00098370 [Dallia pectoralis]